MKGVLAVLDQVAGKNAAALIVDGVLSDLLIDPPDGFGPRPGAIYRARAMRPMKGQAGLILDLGGGDSGFLRQAKGIGMGEVFLVQVASEAEYGKAPPVSPRLQLKGRYGVLTPDAPGINISRSIRDEAVRDELELLAREVMEGADPGLGLVLRTVAAEADADALMEDLLILRQLAEAVLSDTGDQPELLVDSPDAHERAWRDWTRPLPDQVDEHPAAFADHAVLDAIEELLTPRVDLGGGASMMVEPTTALVAIDVNTGGDFSMAAGLKANLAAARDLPRQLRLRGLGGQIVVDFAPMPHKDRRNLESALKKAFRSDETDTTIVGWTPLGHLELQRKRARIPLSRLV